jgi:hypothetical protein
VAEVWVPWFATCGSPGSGIEADAFEQVTKHYQPSYADGVQLRGLTDLAEAPLTVGLNLSDAGNAERFVILHGDRVRYSHEQSCWYVWSGKRWEPDGVGAVMEMARRTATSICDEARSQPDQRERKQIAEWWIKSESDPRLRAMLHQAQSKAGKHDKGTIRTVRLFLAALKRRRRWPCQRQRKC